MHQFRGILLLVFGLLAVGSTSSQLLDKQWWETALVYQIWPRGFQDSDGDGEGDLQGITNRLDYLQELGIDTIWLNPIYSSPLKDSGYDISDYTEINPLFGNLQVFDEFIQQAHKRDLKVILDIVPNHSSDQHKWFLQSSQNNKQYSDYYIWANGSKDQNGNKIPPNNWISTYNDKEGSAWTWHDTRQQWYYHKFHKSQPDLNLRNKNVIQELLDVFNFWLKRKVDGFRIGAVSYLYEDKDLKDEPVVGNGTYTSGLPESIDLVYKFRSYIDNWVKENNAPSKLLIAESYDSDEMLISLYGNATHNGIPPFNFRFITSVQNTSTAEHIKNVLEDWFKKLPNKADTNWVLSNHDTSRAASRIGLNRVDGLHMLSLLLPGQAYTYYGEEIGMLDRKMSWNETIDPMGCSRSKEIFGNYSRDPARTPMQWDSSTSAGFSLNKITYLPVHPDYTERNVKAQLKSSQSNLKTYKSLATLRKDKVFTHGDYEFATLNNDRVFVFKRSLANNPTYIVVINLGLRQETVNLTSVYPNLKDPVEIIIASSNAVNITSNISAQNVILTANAAFVLKAEDICNCESSTEPGGSGTTPSTPECTTEKNSALISSSVTWLIGSISITVVLLNILTFH
ncbi:maltase A3-like isoform X2 [Bombus affinis]|nr:maltase A3-like isoform X2 [Bombus affinis]XP_050589491.1 maltase A3-like isoform X2 [Bombus affinis]XP_050589492.1 maltase A3-like isoform X2 [Bombus affinis]XP_050589493.1 maltase A3-like isoform X2 [Bombus affinis]